MVSKELKSGKARGPDAELAVAKRAYVVGKEGRRKRGKEGESERGRERTSPGSAKYVVDACMRQ